MRKNHTFAAALLAASIPSLAQAQLARECFFVTDLWGPEVENSSLISSLPLLMTYFEPGMLVSKVVAYQEQNARNQRTHIAGLQV